MRRILLAASSSSLHFFWPSIQPTGAFRLVLPLFLTTRAFIPPRVATMTRRSTRGSSSTTTVAKALLATPKKTKKAAKTIKKTKSSATTTNSSVGGVVLPWYHVFTKGDLEYNDYMATEWSYETRGDRPLYEKICLEGAQAGLSWQTILRKRDAYRQVFYQFDPHKVAAMTEADVERILASTADDPRELIVRHRGKIEATIHNAKCLLEMQKEAGDAETALDTFLWSFVQDKPILHSWGANFTGDYSQLSDCPSQTLASQKMSKALKKKGWKFVGPTTCYAMMQSVGMVVDHPVHSPEWEVARQRLLQRPGGYQDGDPVE
jgi:DNA-3-methyladenine glycosylase I